MTGREYESGDPIIDVVWEQLEEAKRSLEAAALALRSFARLEQTDREESAR